MTAILEPGSRRLSTDACSSDPHLRHKGENFIRALLYANLLNDDSVTSRLCKSVGKTPRVVITSLQVDERNISQRLCRNPFLIAVAKDDWDRRRQIRGAEDYTRPRHIPGGRRGSLVPVTSQVSDVVIVAWRPWPRRSCDVHFALLDRFDTREPRDGLPCRSIAHLP